MEKKNTILLSVVAMATLLVAVVGATFAFFAVQETNTANVEVKAGTSAASDVFSATGSGNLTLNVTNDVMMEHGDNVGGVAVEATNNSMKISLNAGSGTTECTYKLSYTSTGDTYTMTTNAADGKEYTLAGEDDSATKQTFAETNMDQLATALAGQTYKITDTADGNATVQTWTFTAKFYNLAISQATQIDKSFAGNVKVTDVVCTNKSASTFESGSLAYALIEASGGEDSITEISLEKEDRITSTSTSTYVGSATTAYYWGTTYNVDTSGNYSLAGTIVKSSLKDCRSGTNTCGNYTIKNTTNETATSTSIIEVTDFKTSGTSVSGNTRKYVNAFYTATTASDAGMYKASDDYGDSYYYRGNVTNNYVQFGSYTAGTTVNGTTYSEETPMYWRVVRVNGDGTVRLIYAGTSKVANGESNNSIIEYSYYNKDYDDKMYVGYMYGTESEPYGDDASTILTDSGVKTSLDTWYNNNLKTTYGTYIADSIFCNDREEHSEDEDGYVYYKNYNRLVTTYEPVLTCTNQRDRFTVDDTTLGNGRLTNPVGLLTVDEAVMAGYSNHGSTTSNYLDIQNYFWTSSPSYFDGDYAYVFYVGLSYLYDSRVNGYTGNSRGARPVINLKSDVLFTVDEDGTYVITTN